MIRTKSQTWMHYHWLILWCLIALPFLFTLSGFTIWDGGKYVNIAHQMLEQKQYWVPYWKGAPYSDKPPLLFWSYIIGWTYLGFNVWWPQLVTLLYATASLLLTQQLAKTLQPKQAQIAGITPYILLAFFNWILFTKQIRVDLPLLCWVLLSWLGLAQVIRQQPIGWVWYTLGIGLGGLTKGPAILVWSILPALSLPWVLGLTNTTKKWWLPLMIAIISGFTIIAIWLLPAMIKGGTEYKQAILYGQVITRIQYHRLGFFYYLINLPMWLLPWWLYRPVWAGFRQLKTRTDLFLGLRFCSVIIVIGLIVLSFFGEKAAHYLLPLYPLFAIFFATSLAAAKEPQPEERLWILSGLWFIAAILIACLPMTSLISFFSPATPYIACLFLIGSILFWSIRTCQISRQVILISVVISMTTVIFNITFNALDPKNPIYNAINT